MILSYLGITSLTTEKKLLLKYGGNARMLGSNIGMVLFLDLEKNILRKYISSLRSGWCT